ncbi:response regulator [Pseudomonas sp. DE0010]|uniref:response regulator transcription factor n=1 Tax=Pseudomonas sp. DE0010 TaxID=2584951 RepID=UPI0011A352E8|nr:helix-turn-helix domain-containing protein [Pseudomonas sp. DE0010]
MPEGLKVARKPHLLLIDDSPEDLRPLLAQLSTQPWKLSVCHEPHQGFQRALALRPDLIVLDVHMPRMNGFSVSRLLRESPVTRDVPIIFLTSASQLEHRLEGLSLGGVDYVVKPYQPAEVIARIRIHLQLTWRQTGADAGTGGDAVDSDQLVLRAAMRFIDEHLDALPSLDALAEAVGTNSKRLSLLFRQHLNTTVFAFARGARLRAGQALLATSDMSVQDIAAHVGFSAAGNFATAFREYSGMTPREFRNQAATRTSTE